MQGQINTNLGNISIDSDVIAAYAGSVALGCTGIVGMAFKEGQYYQRHRSFY